MANFLQFLHALIFDVLGRFGPVLAVPVPPRAQIRVPRVRAAQNGPVRPSFELILASKWPLFDFKNAMLLSMSQTTVDFDRIDEPRPRA